MNKYKLTEKPDIELLMFLKKTPLKIIRLLRIIAEDIELGVKIFTHTKDTGGIDYKYDPSPLIKLKKEILKLKGKRDYKYISDLTEFYKSLVDSYYDIWLLGFTWLLTKYKDDKNIIDNAKYLIDDKNSIFDEEMKKFIEENQMVKYNEEEFKLILDN